MYFISVCGSPFHARLDVCTARYNGPQLVTLLAPYLLLLLYSFLMLIGGGLIALILVAVAASSGSWWWRCCCCCCLCGLFVPVAEQGSPLRYSLWSSFSQEQSSLRQRCLGYCNAWTYVPACCI